MKKLFLLLVITFSLSCCDKDDDKTPIEQLPPATTTGANTFGCLLDGEVFKPGFYNNSYQCFYQYVNGKYYFWVSGNMKDKNQNSIEVGVGTEKLSISEGQILNLYERVDGNSFGIYLFNIDFNNTSSVNTGELKITKLDIKNNIVAGTFWYNIKDGKGITHQIREGRFDMQFTK